MSSEEENILSGGTCSLKDTRLGYLQIDMHILADVNPSIITKKESLSKAVQGSATPSLAS